MDVLIVERDNPFAEVLADAMAHGEFSVAVVPSEQAAAAIPLENAPRVIITGINRKGEDMKGMEVARDLCACWKCCGIIYLATLWPERLRELSDEERFLTKPVSLTELTHAVGNFVENLPSNQHRSD